MTGVAGASNLGSAAFSRARAQAADPKSGGLRYESDGTNRECV
jgi:hypothetical protein